MNSQVTILIVDDEEAIRRLLRYKLSAEGYQCHEAGNAEQALQQLRSRAVDLMILDVKMPGKSGIEVLPEIRSSYPDTAVIMATVITDASLAVQCMKQGAYDYFAKPFNLDEVSLGVGRALERIRLERENRDYQHNLEQKVEEQARHIRQSFFNAITALVYALEAKDPYTSGHSQRVTTMSLEMARRMALSGEDVENIRLAGLIHDIGKIGVREAVLGKKNTLTEPEFEHIRYHCQLGEHILMPIMGDYREILRIVRHHHERFDGTGYPDGLAGNDIPLGARILAIADSYDAMTSERPYRQSLSPGVALAEIERCAGTQFDPGLAALFLRLHADRVNSK